VAASATFTQNAEMRRRMPTVHRKPIVTFPLG
jgi:hypothetical protein